MREGFMDLFLKKFLQIMPLIFAYSVVSLITYCYIAYYTFDRNLEFSYFRIFLFIIGLLFLFMFIICHLLSVFVHPGKPDQSRLKQLISSKNLSDNNSNTEKDSEESELFCKKCELYRPRRAHHCKQCNSCILKMDHHCPWIANCVGFYNQKFFFLFLFYTLCGCFLALCGLFTKFREIDGKLDYYFAVYKYIYKLIVNSTDTSSLNPTDATNDKIGLIEYSNSTITENIISSQNQYDNTVFDNYAILMSFLLAIITLFGVSVLFGYQIHLISNNMTCIEYYKYKPKETSPFYKPTKLQNLKNVLGKDYFSWFIPIFHNTKQNDGYFYVNSHLDFVYDSNLAIN